MKSEPSEDQFDRDFFLIAVVGDDEKAPQHVMDVLRKAGIRSVYRSEIILDLYVERTQVARAAELLQAERNAGWMVSVLPSAAERVQHVIIELRTPESPEIRGALLDAALLIENGTGGDDYHHISPAMDREKVRPESIPLLRLGLIQFAQQNREHPDVGSAIWALSRLKDESLRPFFLAEMRHHFEARRVNPVWQADCALKTFGHGVPYEYAAGQTDHEPYFKAVDAYLEKHAT